MAAGPISGDLDRLKQVFWNTLLQCSEIHTQEWSHSNPFPARRHPSLLRCGRLRFCGALQGLPYGGFILDVMLQVLLALIVVILMARTLGSLFRAIDQPPVIGEIISGVVLGPSVLGHLALGVACYLLLTSVAPFLNVIAQIGVIFYMFLVGLELDPKLLRNHRHATVAISHASILAPFLMGAALAVFLYPRFSSPSVSFTSFSLFIGVAMSITAFPVLARILTDRGIHKTRTGAIASDLCSCR
jgi:Kef-type K+ transport system membrane component KefB